MSDSRFHTSNHPTLSLQELLEIDVSRLNAGDIEAIGIRAEAAFMQISCRSLTTSSQKHCMTQWQVLKTRCSAELTKRTNENIFSRQTSHGGRAETDTTLALAWHARLFDRITRG